MTFTTKFSQAQIAAIVEEYNAGADRKELCKKHGISVRTLFRWQEDIGLNRPALLQLVQRLYNENAHLKKMLKANGFVVEKIDNIDPQ
jgi:putative transposase